MPQSSELTEIIVQTVAEYENVAPSDLPPLADKIDSETFHQLTVGDRQLTEPLEFEYLWYGVLIHPDGEVTITP